MGGKVPSDGAGDFAGCHTWMVAIAGNPAVAVTSHYDYLPR